MATYRVHEDGVAQARQLIDAGKCDDDTEWSDAAPSADDENEFIEKHGYEDFGRWFLAIDPEANEGTKKRYSFPYGDLRKVHRRAVVAAKQRAAQNEHDAIAKAAAELLEALDRAGDA